jgi:ADP-heptose:LPS heptosyltransferase
MLLPPLLCVWLPTKLAMLWPARRASRSRIESPRRDGRSFLVVRLDGLGDVVLTTPLFRELKHAFPGSSCTVVVQDAFRPLLATNPHIDEIIGLRPLQAAWVPERMVNLLSVVSLYWGRLRGRVFDIAVSPRWDVDDQFATLLCSLADAKERVGYTEAASSAKQQSNRGFDAVFSTCLSAGAIRHEVLRNLEIVKALGGKVEDSRLEITLTHRDREFASKLLANVPVLSKLVAVGIGGRSTSRHWPLENYAESLTRLGKEHHVQPVIVCSHDERQEARKLASLLPGEAIIVSDAPLRKVCTVLERCDLFIGNDSGSAHLAGAMNCKTIVISRHPSNGDPDHANSPVRFAPYCDRVCVLQPVAGVDGCKVACVSSEPHCITAVSVDQVLAAACEMLGSEPLPLAWVQANVAPPHGDDMPAAFASAAADALKTAAGLSRAGRSRPVSLT